jgi:hypothetical protein
MFYPLILTLGRTVVVLFILLGVILALNTFSYLNFDPTYGFLRLKQEAVATGWYLPFYYSHVFTGGVILIAGFIQFSRKVRTRWPSVHRRTGYVYVIGILFLAAPGGMAMSFFIDRGAMVSASFVMQCSLWIYFTLTAFQEIKNGNVVSHEHWMIRSFSLTLAAITLRIYIFTASWFADLNQPVAYAILAWSSWLPNLLVAELIIRKKITWLTGFVSGETTR